MPPSKARRVVVPSGEPGGDIPVIGCLLEEASVALCPHETVTLSSIYRLIGLSLNAEPMPHELRKHWRSIPNGRRGTTVRDRFEAPRQ
jgi:hypothetical protein